MVAIAKIDEIRSLGFGSISGSYANIGSQSEHLIRVVHITNNTDGDLMFTDDVTKDKIFVAAGSFVLLDVQSNANQADDRYVLPIGTQMSVKQVTAPTEGDVYITYLY